jgi:hypothetical protein
MLKTVGSLTVDLDPVICLGEWYVFFHKGILPICLIFVICSFSFAQGADEVLSEMVGVKASSVAPEKPLTDAQLAELPVGNTKITLFGAVTPGVEYQALTGIERWNLYLRENYWSPSGAFRTVFTALVAQGSNRPPEWGQGFKGYGKRSASAFATYTIQSSIESAGDALLKQDPRYIRCDCEKVSQRVKHAFIYDFFTKNSEGDLRFAYAKVGSAYAAQFIQTLWYPDHYSLLKTGFRQGSQSLAFGFGINLIVEFGPDFKKLLRRK